MRLREQTGWGFAGTLLKKSPRERGRKPDENGRNNIANKLKKVPEKGDENISALAERRDAERSPLKKVLEKGDENILLFSNRPQMIDN